MAKKILMIGATGMLGYPVACRLMKDEYQVKMMSHSPDLARRVFGATADIVEGDVTKPETLDIPMEGCDAVYMNLGAKMNLDKYDLIEHQGPANVAEAAKKHGIKQIGMISFLEVGEADKSKWEYMAGKFKGEQALQESGIPYTVFRSCWFFESLPKFIVGKRATLFGKQPYPRSWIASSDYAGMVSKAYRTEEAKNKIFHIKGVEKKTMHEAMTEFCEIVYPNIKVDVVPQWLMTIMAKFSRKKEIKGVARFMKYFNQNPEPELNGEAEKILGPALTTLKDWAEDYKIKLMARKG